jgi:imidazolonepropionase-like amidohydrolase
MKFFEAKTFTLRRLLLWSPLLLLLWLALLLCWPMPQPPLATLSNQPLVIHNVQLVDVQTGEVHAGQSVWIAHGTIQRITATSADDLVSLDSVTERLSATEKKWHPINGNNQFLIPGLQDMHTHSMQLAPQLQHPLWLAAGVTSVRDMSGCMAASDSFIACAEDRKRWQQQLQQGVRSSPRYPIQSSFALNGGAEVPEGLPAYLKLQSAADAKALVQHYQQLGVDQLKMYELLSLQQFQWLASAVKETAGITLAGHQPWLVPLEKAVAGGMKSLEHGRVFLFECAAAIGPYKAQPMREGLITSAVWQQILDSQDAELCQQKMQLLAASDSWWSPTLLTLQLGAKAMLPQFRADLRLNTVPWLLQKLWQADADGMVERGRFVDEQGDAQYPQQQAFTLALQQVQQAHKLGVKIIAGTDAPDSFVFTGSGLHDELALYVQAGLTPLQALQTATLNAARYSGTADRSGRIAVGFDADLVLLAANPLTDIQALRQVQGLVIAGQWYDQDRLTQLQQFAVEQAGSLRMNLQLMSGALRSAMFRQQFAD